MSTDKEYDVLHANIVRVVGLCQKHDYVDRFGSVMNWTWDDEDSTVQVNGMLPACGRGCCPPEPCDVSFPKAWLSYSDEAVMGAIRALSMEEELVAALPLSSSLSSNIPSRQRL